MIEIVSTNWSNDYALKLEDYEVFGIEEYWICDYLGWGGKRYIGPPKQPTSRFIGWMQREFINAVNFGDRRELNRLFFQSCN